MPNATATTRRGLIGSGAAFALLPSAGLADGGAAGDAELLRRCATFADIDAAEDRINRGLWPGHTEQDVDGVLDQWHEAIWSLIDTPATTPAGIRAKGAALKLALEREVPTHLGETVETAEAVERHELLAYSLARDILAASL